MPQRGHARLVRSQPFFKTQQRLSTATNNRLTCRNVAASLPLSSPDNEGLYKKMTRYGIT